MRRATYEAVERLAMDADAANDTALADDIRDMLDVFWPTLSAADAEALGQRTAVGPTPRCAATPPGLGGAKCTLPLAHLGVCAHVVRP